MSKTRLTWKSPEDGKSYLRPLDPDCGRCDLENEQCKRHVRMIIEKLAKYEDTGLEPEEAEE